MTSVELPESLIETVQKYNQSHLLQYWENLDDSSRQKLLHDLQQIDFAAVDQLVQLAIGNQKEEVSTETANKISPLQQAVRFPETEDEKEALQKARETGVRILDSGSVGAILVAGGQGSRLGFPHPKGMYPIGPVTDRTLFQIFFEQLLALSNRHNVSIPYFIMTSDATHEETEMFLQEHNWFGYPPEDVFLFRQGKLPAVDNASGKILLEAQDTIAMSPDGHGGLLQALDKAGLLKEMKQRNTEYLYYHQVDNPSAVICDSVMLGYHIKNQAEMSTKVVSKRAAEEKVGIVAEVGGTQQIIEYSDLDDNLSCLQDDAGRLVYWAGNIAVHIFNRELLERLTQQDDTLPIHIANKKVNTLNEHGMKISPESPNAFKFEQFIFDAIPKAKNPLVIEASRADEFNPVKNGTGNDSPSSAKIGLSQQATRWLQHAGINIKAETKVEISPLIALQADDLNGYQLSEQQLEDVQNSNELLIIPEE